jgi:serine/threonine protein kinase
VASLKHIFNELHYEMTRKIAEGGMGLVYEAVQLGSGNFRKVVAVKLIREEYSAIEEFQNNFIGEARLVADLIHTHIVQTYHLGQVSGQYFMVMEFVRGINLEQFIERHRQLGRPVPVDLAVTSLLAHMHVRGKAFKFELTTPDGKTETLLDLPNYDFNWQLRYDFKQPRILPRGSTVRITAVFDNSADNKSNPDPTKLVRWGPQTYDEMMIGYFEYFVPINR